MMRRTFPLCLLTLLSFFIIHMIGSVSLWLSHLSIVSIAQAAAPITPSLSDGLNTLVSQPFTLPSGHIQYNITGGTRPGGLSGTNLFHSFGDFNVPSNNIANFLNSGSINPLNGALLPSDLPTSNILI